MKWRAGKAEAERFPTAKDWAEGQLQLRNRLMAQRHRAFPIASLRKCPACSRKTLEGRDDLLRESAVGSIVLVHHNLHGARCRSCGTEVLETYEELALEETGPERRLSDYLAAVTNVSGKNIGTYWPKDIVREMQLHSQDSLYVQILDDDTMVIRRQHGRKAGRGRAQSRGPEAAKRGSQTRKASTRKMPEMD